MKSTYSRILSLEQKTLFKITVSFWNDDDIKELILKYTRTGFGSEKQQWNDIEAKVAEKISQLPLPETLKNKLLGFIKPTWLEILRWLDCYGTNLHCGINLPNEFSWTPQGTLDGKRTEEALIKDENLSLFRRYKLACIYCLENHIPILWNKIAENVRGLFYSEDPRDVDQLKMVLLWTYDINGKISRMKYIIAEEWSKCTPYQYAFEYAAAECNKVATELFLKKLTHEERQESLLKSAIRIARGDYYFYEIGGFTDDYCDFAEVLCFLLSQINEEQQVEVFKANPYRVLMAFLDWPRQDFFLETVHRMWSFLPVGIFANLLLKIVQKIVDGYKDYNYLRLFEQFWQYSPITHRRGVFRGCKGTVGALLSKLFHSRNEKYVLLILNDATTEDKEKLIFSEHPICLRLVSSKDWDLLKFYISESISSQEKMVQFKKEFLKESVHCSSRKGEYETKFSQILDILIKKRGIEEENCSSAKKFRR